MNSEQGGHSIRNCGKAMSGPESRRHEQTRCVGMNMSCTHTQDQKLRPEMHLNQKETGAE
jgi:hypothetical protein